MPFRESTYGVMLLLLGVYGNIWFLIKRVDGTKQFEAFVKIEFRKLENEK